MRFTKEHEWIDILEDGKRARVGITDYAQHELGDIVYVELPSVDDEFEKGEAFGVVESVKAVSDLYMPVSGRVVEANSQLEGQPELINHSPQDEGWIVTIELTDPEELSGLMENDDYDDFIGTLAEKKQKKRTKKAATDDDDDDGDDDDEMEGFTRDDEMSDDEK